MAEHPGNPVDPQTSGRPQHPLANYQFSSDELRVLRECNTESFFQRSLPLGTAFGLLSYYGVKRGFLSPNVKYGVVPKVVVSVIVGYFIGKFSYQRRCAEKIMQLPNSKLGELLKQRKQGNMYNSLTSDPGIGVGLALSPFSSPSTDLYSDEGLRNKQSNALDLDTERPTQDGLDDTYRPSLDSSTTTFEEKINFGPSKQPITYEELRKKNHEEYMKKMQNPYNKPIPPAEGTPIVRSSRSKIENDTDVPKEKLNRYGDIWSK